MTKTELARQRRANWIVSGLCSGCGQFPPIGGKLCDNCRQKRKVYYHRRILSKICPCGNKLNDEQKRCDICLGRSRNDHYKLVNEVITYYGGACICCGNITKAHLTIDHIGGGGNQHAREIGRGVALYRWLKRNKFPTGFQVLCANCNHGKYRNAGICPHISITTSLNLPKHTLCRRRAFEQALLAYGSECKTCGETQPLFLNLDHIENDGAEHRREIGTALLAVWARQNNYPSNLQILCDNCNLTKARPRI